ncbi:MAG: glycosyltransferase family 1 protein [Microbacterium sp.]
MRVLFDAYWWGDGAIANRTVQRQFIHTWARLFPDDDLVLALRRGVSGRDVPTGVRVVRTRLWPHALSNRWEIPRLQRKTRAHIALVHNYTPWRGKSLVFIHDVMFIDHPQWFSASERLYFRPMLPWARSAAAIATSTRTEAARIVRLGRGIPEPVVTGLGISPALAEPQPQRPVLPDGIDTFAITVGRLNVRKNLERILAAAALSTRIDAQHPLLVVGSSAHSGVGADLSPQIRRSIDEGRVVLLGGVSDDELAWLYANSSLCVTLSLDEGFGLPAIEAACFDAPLVASDIAVFRETVGDYARFVAPDAPLVAIAAAVDETFGTPVDGSAIRARWTWEHAVTVLRAAVAG